MNKLDQPIFLSPLADSAGKWAPFTANMSPPIGIVAGQDWGHPIDTTIWQCLTVHIGVGQSDYQGRIQLSY